MYPIYYKTIPSCVVNVSEIYTIHYFEFQKTFRYYEESHDFWEINYVDKGSIVVTRDGVEHKLNAGDFIFLAPNETHLLRAADSAPNVFVISFTCKSKAMQQFIGFVGHLQDNLKLYFSTIIKEAELTYNLPKNDPTMDKLNPKSDAILGGEQIIKNSLEMLLIHLLRGNSENIKIFQEHDEMDSYLLQKVKEYIAIHLREKITLDDICTEMNYSKNYLCRFFVNQVGITIGTYITKCKVEEAKFMIRDGKSNITEISNSLSFDNPQYFARVFKKVSGMTPTEFKHSLR